MRAIAILATVLALAGCLPQKNTGKAPDAPATPPAIVPAGRIKLTQILDEYYNPQVNANRAVLADKYFGKYWEIDMRGNYRIEEDYLDAYVAFFQKVHVHYYFRDKRDLLKFSPDKKIDPTMIVGKAVSAERFEDCFIP